MPDAAMIYAAGFGTRMGALTQCTPKPLINVADRPLIDYTIDLTADAKLSTIVVNTHYLAQQVEDYLEPFGHIQTLRESPDILETGGGLKNALPFLGSEPVFTLNSDAVWTGDNPLTKLATAWDPQKMDALLMLVPKQSAKEHRGAGDFHLSPTGVLTRRGSDPSAPFVYSGAQIIKTDRLVEIQEKCFSLNRLWDSYLSQDRAFGIVHTGGWIDVGRPEGIAIAESHLELYV